VDGVGLGSAGSTAVQPRMARFRESLPKHLAARGLDIEDNSQRSVAKCLLFAAAMDVAVSLGASGEGRTGGARMQREQCRHTSGHLWTDWANATHML
jgi:hypothetical protein